MRQVIKVDLTHISRQPWFDKEELLRQRAGSLEQFNEIVRLRAEYGHFKPSPLSYWVANGRWHLDEFGQCMPVHVQGTTTAGREALEQYRDRIMDTGLASVKDWSNFLQMFHPEISWGYSGGGGQHLPHHGAQCVHCKAPWTMDNSTDAWSIRLGEKDFQAIRDPRWVGMKLAEVRELVTAKPIRSGVEFFMRRHAILTSSLLEDHTEMSDYPGKPAKNAQGWASADKCARYAQIDWNTYVVTAHDTLYFYFMHLIHHDCRVERANKLNEERTITTFEQAGLHVKNFLEMPNDYGSEAYNGKWMLVQTEAGYFLVGWRKRVMFLRVLKMEYIMGELRFAEVGKERHFNSYEDLGEHLNNHYVDCHATAVVGITISQGTSNLKMVLSGPVDNTIKSIEAYLTQYGVVNFDYNANDKITVQALQPGDVPPNYYRVASRVMIGSRHVGFIETHPDLREWDEDLDEPHQGYQELDD